MPVGTLVRAIVEASPRGWQCNCHPNILMTLQLAPQQKRQEAHRVPIFGFFVDSLNLRPTLNYQRGEFSPSERTDSCKACSLCCCR